MQYTLKKEYEDAIISRQTRVGVVIFNANNVHRSEYEMYAKLGFDYVFEQETIEIPQPKIIETLLDNAIKKTIDYQGVINETEE